jgi:hypothetical protein
MPRFDRTGPQGKGPKTGRRLGNCDDKESPQSKPDQNKNSWLDIFLRILRLIKNKGNK